MRLDEQRATNVSIALAVTAALFRLIPLHWLHPLNWDEVEFYRATKWIAEGRLPFRDFWEHHSPLPWFLFAPVARFVDSIDTGAIVAMRWAQIPVWIAAFVLVNAFMRNAGLPRFARWSAIVCAVASSFLMISAIEFRVDPVAIALFLGGLVAWQRDTPRSMFLAGVLFCLTGFANLRLGPLLVAAVLLLRIVNRNDKSWRGNARANWIFAGGIAMFAAAVLFFAATRSWTPMVRQLIYENAIGERTAPPIDSMFLNRLFVVFGLHVRVVDDAFEPEAIDPGGILIVVGGVAGIALALLRARKPDDLFVLVLLQLANLLFMVRMKYIYNYHFQTVVLLMVPLVALFFERIRRREIVLALLVLPWCVNAYASVLRGKEDDRAYQDLVMREAHARTPPHGVYWGGIPWALQREPAYRFWFLPELARQLVKHGHAPPYSLRQVMANAPAVVITDRNALVWMGVVQKELGSYFIRHYTPLWRNLWIPGMNVRLSAQRPRHQWTVPRDGEYALYVPANAARHPWFSRPMYISAYDYANVELTLPPPGGHPALRWWVDGNAVEMPPRVKLRAGQRVAVASTSNEPIAVFLMSGNDKILFRQPPEHVTLEAYQPRVTHWPRFSR